MPSFPSNDPTMLADLAEALKYKTFIDAAAAKYGIPPSVIAGIGSRESRWGLALKPQGPSGTGDFARRHGKLPSDNNGGFGRGLLQIDYNAHEFARTGNWQDAEANIEYGAGVLKQNLDLLGRHLKADLLRAAIAAYNCGAGTVLRALTSKPPLDADHFTAHSNYSADVMERAAWFVGKGWG